MDFLRRPLRRAIDAAESALDRIFGPAANPLVQLGAIGFFLYWIVAVSGIYLYVGFDTSVSGAFTSVERMTRAQWYAGGVMRSFHRYASDAMVAVMALHALREFALDRYRGTRWFSWLVGVPIVWLLYASGITGYWLVWDRLAQYVAIASTELLDWLPIFGEPIARNFLAPGSLNDRFFTLLVFLHIAVPLILLFVLWLHLQRISRPRINPPRALAGATLAGLTAVSLWRPALSQGQADLARVPGEIGLDWFYLPLYPLADLWSRGAVWAILAGFTLILAALPWLPPLRRPRVAEVDLAHCNGCARCVEDCPYQAVTLTPRTDGRPFQHEVAVDAALCVGCGICMGACPSSSPFRRSAELRTGIDLPDFPLRALRERVEAAAARLAARPRVLVIACAHGAGAGDPAAVEVPCAAMVPPSLLDYALSRDLADGVAIAGCAERACHHRLGVAWTRARIAGERDPQLRARVPRERLATVWASAFERPKLARELAAFAARIAGLPPLESGVRPPAEERRETVT